ncbi:DNA polymerase III subunit chi [Gallaecimonas pentaromativorans]|uniref:DNA polymerase III chi subunit n=1 Tax=Gallaecimonas pentaromativorans TaxID=584787 RepID=A0A3N1PKR1_9GAMM|nr:DNA polymerase III subunit chi [Gallaecimonas pentaromativorans]MED5524719.1 DNA polymerase III subunit chi [Pseudomonadota bacterium]ROQ28709.1 DNA polymerase III chi subunit [Gallaecimonas pentaromativorans]
MADVTFCSLPDDNLVEFACQVAAHFYQLRQPVLITCQDKAQADAVDEALWVKEPASFVPHNLADEGPKSGSPVAIYWPEAPAPRGRAVLINLHEAIPHVAVQCAQIFEAVPNSEALKVAARTRFRSYQQQGAAPKHLSLADFLAQTH